MIKLKLIYPRWPKLKHQTEFHLPPHGPVVFAAALPDDVEVEFVDENLDDIDFDETIDLVGISMMLTIQVKRGWQIGPSRRRKDGRGNLGFQKQTFEKNLQLPAGSASHRDGRSGPQGYPQKRPV